MERILTKRDKQEVQSTSSEHLVDPARAFSPDTNVYDTGDALVFAVDLPGAEKGKIHLEVDENNSLVIRAEYTWREPDGAVFRQFNPGDYYRAFTLSSEYDKEKISTKLNDGVLEITIPKKEEAKPRRIQINV